MRRSALLTATLVAGCSGAGSVEWTVALEGFETPPAWIVVQIRAGGCGGAPLQAREVARGGDAQESVRVAPGRYGFYAAAVDASCRAIGDVCRDVEVGAGTAPIRLELAPSGAAADLCELEVCRASSCVQPPDGGAPDAAADASGCASDGGICAPPSCEDWSACDFPDECVEVAERTRRCTDHVCSAGACVPLATPRVEREACPAETRDTDGAPCGEFDRDCVPRACTSGICRITGMGGCSAGETCCDGRCFATCP